MQAGCGAPWGCAPRAAGPQWADLQLSQHGHQPAECPVCTLPKSTCSDAAWDGSASIPQSDRWWQCPCHQMLSLMSINMCLDRDERTRKEAHPKSTCPLCGSSSSPAIVLLDLIASTLLPSAGRQTCAGCAPACCGQRCAASPGLRGDGGICRVRALPSCVPPCTVCVLLCVTRVRAHTCFCFGYYHYNVFTTVHFTNMLFILQ